MSYLYGVQHIKPHVNKIFTKPKNVTRIMTGTRYNVHTNPVFKKFKVAKLDDL